MSPATASGGSENAFCKQEHVAPRGDACVRGLWRWGGSKGLGSQVRRGEDTCERL